MTEGIEMTDEELARKAAELGLQELAGSQPGDLKRAIENAEALASRIPQDIHWTEEPCHIFDVGPHRINRS